MTILRVMALGIVAAVSLADVTAQAPAGNKAVDSTTVDPEAAIKAGAARMRAEAEARKNWTVSRTPWGDPDLRGV
jgi:hypothetical protein